MMNHRRFKFKDISVIIPPMFEQHKKSNKSISVVILAAGFGLRLKNNKPKALVALDDGKTILDYQLEKLTKYISKDKTFLVVGYKKELVMEQHPELTYVYNEEYSRTNTAKSLLRALRKVKNGDVLWLNGDVVFDDRLIAKIINKSISYDKSCILVDDKRCGEEEVKYDITSEGNISFISKEVVNPRGEALGINLVLEKDIPLLIKSLEKVDVNDYFEKGVENMICKEGALFVPVNTKGLFCQEIDFPEDLEVVQDYLKQTRKISVPQ